jgi:ubiquinone/menaquinone biosynthesis C-methylase UbiE
MENRPWERWNDEGVAETIESIWTEVSEKVHRDALAELCAVYMSGPGLQVLEVGCGTGRIYERLVPRLVSNENYTGVDTSEKMLEIGRRKHPQARLQLGDGFGLAFPDRSVDVAVSFEVLGHLPEIGGFLREMMRVSRKHAIFTVWPCAEGMIETSEVIRGSRFIHRQYSHDYLCQQLAQALPGLAIDLDVAILYTECWGYVASPRSGPPGVTLRHLFPVGNYRLSLLREMATTQR